MTTQDVALVATAGSDVAPAIGPLELSTLARATTAMPAKPTG